MNKKFSYNFIFVFILMVALFVSNIGNIAIVHADEHLPQIKLNVSSATIVKGKSFSLKVYNVTESQIVTFSSADKEIAVVSAGGRIKGIANGTTVITVNVSENDTLVATLTCDVLVGPPAISVKFTKSEIEMSVGMRRITKTLVQPSNTVEAVKYFSEDSSIATVSSSGRILAKEVGETYIFAIIGNGKYDSCKVTVTGAGTAAPVEDDVEPTETPTPTPTPAVIPSVTPTPTPAPTITPKITPSVPPSAFPTGILIDPIKINKNKNDKTQNY